MPDPMPRPGRAGMLQSSLTTAQRGDGKLFPQVPVGRFPPWWEVFSVLRDGRGACTGQRVGEVSLCGRPQPLRIAVWLLPFVLGGNGPVPRGGCSRGWLTSAAGAFVGRKMARRVPGLPRVTAATRGLYGGRGGHGASV